MRVGQILLVAALAAITLLVLDLTIPQLSPLLHEAHDAITATARNASPSRVPAQAVSQETNERILSQPSPNGWTAVSLVDGQGHASVFYYFDPEVGVRCYRDSSVPLGCVRIGAEP